MGGVSRLGVSRASAIAALIAAAVVPIAGTGPGSAARASRAGSIAGVATTKEQARPPIRASIDTATCGETLPDESIAVDSAGRLGGVVVSIAGVRQPAPAEVNIINEKCRFVPRIATLRPGGTVKTTSHDPMIHTMHAAADGRALFNVSLPLPNLTVSRPISRAGVVTLSCSTHTWMRGYLYVTDSLTVVSAADGSFKLDGVPPGTHTLQVWHEALKLAVPATVVVKDGETATVQLSLVGAPVTRRPVRISMSALSASGNGNVVSSSRPTQRMS